MRVSLDRASGLIESDEGSTDKWTGSLSREDHYYFVPMNGKARPKRFRLEGIFSPILMKFTRKQKGDWSQSLPAKDHS